MDVITFPETLAPSDRAVFKKPAAQTQVEPVPQFVVVSQYSQGITKSIQ